MSEDEVPVLIVGGSLVGLTTAMLLGHHGVPSLAVERHAGTAIHPRAGHFQLRTMELLRQLGLEERVRAKSLETYSPTGGIIAVESLAGRELATPMSRSSTRASRGLARPCVSARSPPRAATWPRPLAPRTDSSSARFLASRSSAREPRCRAA